MTADLTGKTDQNGDGRQCSNLVLKLNVHVQYNMLKIILLHRKWLIVISQFCIMFVMSYISHRFDYHTLTHIEIMKSIAPSLLSSACSISSSCEYKSVDTDNFIILRFILLRITGLGYCAMLSCLIILLDTCFTLDIFCSYYWIVIIR